MNQEEIILRVENLTKTFRSRGNKNIITGLWRPEWQETEAVIDANFAIRRGESVAFLGPNGAGKTTTTKMMSGIMYPDSGLIDILGFTPQERKPEYLKKIGLVMGNKTGLNWDLTASQSFSLLKEIYEIPEEKFQRQLDYLTDLLSTKDYLDKQVRKLSLGQRMKVELIAAILHEPEILFLDEPTIGLDIDAKFAIREFLIKLQKEKNVTIILTSHDMDDIEHVCQRVIVINLGKIIFDDSLAKLNSKYANWRYFRLTFDHDIEEEEFKGHGKILEQKAHQYLLKVNKKKLVDAVAHFSSIKGLVDINIESVPLEKIVSDLFNSK